jgi:hypothetical protein
VKEKTAVKIKAGMVRSLRKMGGLNFGNIRSFYLFRNTKYTFYFCLVKTPLSGRRPNKVFGTGWLGDASGGGKICGDVALF